MTANRTFLRSATAAALALVSIAATFPASAATTRQDYQKRVYITCSVGCVAALPKLSANQALDIDHVVCDINTSGYLIDAVLEVLAPSPDFSMPLSVTWKRSFDGHDYFTLGGEVSVRVPLGRQARVVIVIGGTPNGSCSFTGTLIKT